MKEFGKVKQVGVFFHFASPEFIREFLLQSHHINNNLKVQAMELDIYVILINIYIVLNNV